MMSLARGKRRIFSNFLKLAIGGKSGWTTELLLESEVAATGHY